MISETLLPSLERPATGMQELAMLDLQDVMSEVLGGLIQEGKEISETQQKL